MVNLFLVGDVMLGRLFNKKIFPRKSLKYPWGSSLKILESAADDILIGNLETTITDSTRKYPGKTFNYKMLPKYRRTLKIAGFNYLSLANNHILDFGEKGLLDTIKNLDEMGIKHTGAGRNISEAQKAVFIRKRGIKVGFLSAADHYTEWGAKKDKAGIWYIPIREGINKYWRETVKIVEETKKKCDFLVFSLHWNYNYVDKIEPIFKDFARLLIDNGVDVIHGHSPHHLLPYEKYRGAYIFYSLGDFIDDYAVDKKYRNDLGMIVNLKVKKKKGNGKKIEIEKIYPTIIKNFQVNLR